MPGQVTPVSPVFNYEKPYHRGFPLTVAKRQPRCEIPLVKDSSARSGLGDCGRGATN
jgi:hypothetical protein